MRARVLEVNDELIYLEVDHQLRFKAPYVLTECEDKPVSSDDVEFHFGQKHVVKNIIIDTVFSQHSSSGSR